MRCFFKKITQSGNFGYIYPLSGCGMSTDARTGLLKCVIVRVRRAWVKGLSGEKKEKTWLLQKY
jgi:hypothetical protein